MGIRQKANADFPVFSRWTDPNYSLEKFHDLFFSSLRALKKGLFSGAR
jgi:hypothetical protein